MIPASTRPSATPWLRAVAFGRIVIRARPRQRFVYLCESHVCDLVIVPAPWLSDTESAGAEGGVAFDYQTVGHCKTLQV